MTGVLTVILILTCPVRGGESSGKSRWVKRWVYVSSNLYVDDNLPKIEKLLRRAKKAGYTGVLFADYKTCTWWTLAAAHRWKANAQRLRRSASALGLELTVCIMPIGYSGSLLAHDVNLASGLPVRQAPLLAKGDRLVPVQTARIENGSFEARDGHKALSFAFQDDPGRGSFLDAETVKHGEVSLRFENVGEVNRHGHGRICQRIEVRPWQQYRIRAWMKTERLDAGQIQLLVIGGGRTLQYQYPQVLRGRRLRHVSRARDLTTDWVEQCVTFNSLEHGEVRVYLGIWGGTTGKIWWDDWRIESAPTLNVLRRESLPVTVTGEGGTVFEEGRDFRRVFDPGLGRNPWPGSYDTRHDPPPIERPSGSRIRDGDRVKLSCYHTVIVHGSQVSCSLDHPKVFDLCALQMRKTREALAPDGFFLSHDEIRIAGWEPGQAKRFGSSGELLAFNIRRCAEIGWKEGRGKPLYVWSDMFDPNHNAKADYYLVNNTLEGSWKGLDPKVVVMKWGGGKRARPGLKFFADRGHKQMIAAYYDGDVDADHRMWRAAAEGVPGILGVMYTTWEHDYDDLEHFARVWWGGGK
ncbi:MAG: hypothetical protein ACYS47_02990 [Planctomycetota bacterium]